MVRRKRRPRRRRARSRVPRNVWRSHSGSPFPDKAIVVHRDIKHFDINPGGSGAIAITKLRLNDIKNYSFDGMVSSHNAADIHAVEQLSTFYQQSSVLECHMRFRFINHPVGADAEQGMPTYIGCFTTDHPTDQTNMQEYWLQNGGKKPRLINLTSSTARGITNMACHYNAGHWRKKLHVDYTEQFTQQWTGANTATNETGKLVFAHFYVQSARAGDDVGTHAVVIETTWKVLWTKPYVLDHE